MIGTAVVGVEGVNDRNLPNLALDIQQAVMFVLIPFYICYPPRD